MSEKLMAQLQQHQCQQRLKSLTGSKPALLPKPKICINTTASRLFSSQHSSPTKASMSHRFEANLNKNDDGISGVQMDNYNQIISCLKEKIKKRSLSVTCDEVKPIIINNPVQREKSVKRVLFKSEENKEKPPNSESLLKDNVEDCTRSTEINEFNLLDEIYAEIEDKQTKKKLHKSTGLDTVSNSSSSSSSSSSLGSKTSSSEPNNKNSDCTCAAASSYTSSNSCSCSSSCSSSSPYSTSASYSSRSSDNTPTIAPPPLPSVPPPPLTNKPELSIETPSTQVNSLSEEIQIEFRNKLCNFNIKMDEKLPNNEQSNIIESNEETNKIEFCEPEYLEPIMIDNQTSKEENKEDSSSNHYSEPFGFSPARLKSYFSKVTSARSSSIDSPKLKINANTRTMNYLIKTSTRLTSTLRLIRARSNSITTPNEVNKKSAANLDQTSIAISRPTLISQTFDLSKQTLIDVKNSPMSSSYPEDFDENFIDDDDASFSSSSGSSSFTESDMKRNNFQSTPKDNKASFKRLSAALSIDNLSPTIGFNTIITNVYEENGKFVAR